MNTARNRDSYEINSTCDQILLEYHNRGMRIFRRNHPDDQISTSPKESFAEHDTRMKEFRHNHLGIPELDSTDVSHRKQAQTLIPLSVSQKQHFSQN